MPTWPNLKTCDVVKILDHSNNGGRLSHVQSKAQYLETHRKDFCIQETAMLHGDVETLSLTLLRQHMDL